MAETLRKINILEMHSSFGYAGGQRNLATFCRTFRPDLFQVFAAAYREGGPQETVFERYGIPYVVSHGDAQLIVNFIRDHRIDVLHIHRSGGEVPLETQIIVGAKAVNPKLIIIEKNIFGQYDPSTRSLIDVHFFQSMMHVHERYLPRAREVFDGDRHKVLYNMVDATAFEAYRMQTSDIAAYRQSIGITPSDFVIGRIGRPDLAKWSDLILDMLPHLLALVPNTKCLLMGVPTSRVKRIQNSAYRDAVIILPNSSDDREVHRFYQTIDVLAHTSKIGECNGNTINEALFWGRPVVTHSTPSKDNGQLEQVIHGVNGYIANYPETFARALADLAADAMKRARMGTVGRDQVLSAQTPEHITQQVEKTIVETSMRREWKFSPAVIDFYRHIQYHPSVKHIELYPKEYKRRCANAYGIRSVKERIWWVLTAPHRRYWQLRDYYDHRYARR